MCTISPIRSKRIWPAMPTDFAVTISDERDLLRDTGGGLIKARALIPDDPFFCVNADNWWTDGAENGLLRMARAWDAGIAWMC